MADCCEHDLLPDAKHSRAARVLRIVLAINAALFLIEFTAGVIARSTALMADSVDMFGDALAYGLSLYVIGRGARWRAGAAVVKGVIILAFGVWILIEAGLKMAVGVTPLAPLMGAFGALALLANLACLRLLWPLRGTDINMRSAFECSRNDVLSNVGVLLAAAGVWFTNESWPDVLIGFVVAVLFLRSAFFVLRTAWPQLHGRELPT